MLDRRMDRMRLVMQLDGSEQPYDNRKDGAGIALVGVGIYVTAIP